MAGATHNTAIFGQPVNLEEEWKNVAVELTKFCQGSPYIEYIKEIACLKLKLIHLQEEVDGCRVHNKNLTSLNDDLSDKLKSLISLQDNQLEQYSTALVLLTEERKDLCHTLGLSQKKVKLLEEQLLKCVCSRSVGAERCNDGTNTQTSQAAYKNTENMDFDIVGVDEFQEIDIRLSGEENDRHLNSPESTVESTGTADLRNIQSSSKTKNCGFVNSMIEKLEKGNTKTSNKILDSELDVAETIHEPEESEVEWLRFRVAELEDEVTGLRESCQSLTKMLEKTYEEMELPNSETTDYTKDQLIMCLRSRLFEAICDLMKVEKQARKIEVKSVACGSSLQRHRDIESKQPSSSGGENNDPPLSQSRSDPCSTPSKCKASKLLLSPASKLKALSEDNYNKLRKFSCWKPKPS